jgi:hypothetical protein
MQSRRKDLREFGITKIVAIDVLTEDDLAVCDLGDRRMRWGHAVNDEAHESSLHREHSPDQDHGRQRRCIGRNPWIRPARPRRVFGPRRRSTPTWPGGWRT